MTLLEEEIENKLFLKDVKLTLTLEPEDTPVRGNFATGNDEVDRAAEEFILKEISKGNPWAWCIVTITATQPSDEEHFPFRGTASLGCCSYTDMEGFMAGGYFEDMQREAVNELVKNINSAVRRGQAARLALINFGEQ